MTSHSTVMRVSLGPSSAKITVVFMSSGQVARPPRFVDRGPDERLADVRVGRRAIPDLLPPPVQCHERRLREVVRPVPVAAEHVRGPAHGVPPGGEVLRELLFVALVHAQSCSALLSFAREDGIRGIHGCTDRAGSTTQGLIDPHDVGVM